MSIKTYVIGPITYALTEFKTFHPTVRSLVELAIEALRPLGEVYSAHVAELFGTLPPQNSGHILKRDAGWVFEADVVVALLPVMDGNPLRTDGTYIEIGLALASDTPLVVAWSSRNAERYSHLIRGLQYQRTTRFLDIDEIARNANLLIDAVVDLHIDRVHQSEQIQRPLALPVETDRRELI